MASQITRATAIGYTAWLDDKALLLKILHLLVSGHEKIKSEISQKLAFILTGGPM